MTLCYVTDRKALPGPPEAQIRVLLEKIEAASRSGVRWIQIREKDLEARQLSELVREAKRRSTEAVRIFVNDRLDTALAAGADGVHLGERSLQVADVRRFLRERSAGGPFSVGVSTHSVAAVREAKASGADYAIFGPVFSTPSKLEYGTPQGVERLGEACRAVTIPVVAIGGITVENARECVAAGAAGIAAIRLFQDARDFARVVGALSGKC
jgi:thiamine-phosphate pyrophosphorylase